MFFLFRVSVAVAAFLVAFKVEASENCHFLDNYSTHEDIKTCLKSLELSYPKLAKVYSIGKSIGGRDLNVIALSESVQLRNVGEPMFKFVANVHGDETVGRQLLLKLAQHLLENYGKDAQITALLNTTEIHLLPSMDPDGFQLAQEGLCNGSSSTLHRKDLNGDFSGDLFSTDVFQNKQPETVAVMKWIYSNPFVLSGSLQGFSPSLFNERNTFDEMDKSLFSELFDTYGNKSNDVYKCVEKGNDLSFKEKLIRSVGGGMPYFNYLYSNCLEIPLQVSCCKFPNASYLLTSWEKNHEGLVSFIEATHWGVKGLVKSEASKSISHAIITFNNKSKIFSTERGEYWRILLPGTYLMSVSVPGYETETREITVLKEKAIIEDFILKKLPHKEVRVASKEEKPDSYGFLQPVNFVHHHFKAMEELLNSIAMEYPNITRLYTIGKSVENRPLYVLEISDNPGKHEPGEPEMKYVANMHGNEVVSREMLLLLAQYLCQNYGYDDRVTKIINSTRLHFLMSMNPDGYERAHEGDYSSLEGRNNAHDVDLNRNFPDQYGIFQENRIPEPETDAVIKWIHSYPFVLSGNLHGGALVANYPYDDSPTHRSNVPNYSPDQDTFLLLVRTYSLAHPRMHLSIPHCKDFNDSFMEGITNGMAWYEVTGGMQDYNYNFASCFEITIEMGCYKFPPQDTLSNFWKENKEPLIKFIEQVHRGINGFVRSTSGNAIFNATIEVEGISKVVRSGRDGDYWRLLSPGNYTISSYAPGYSSHSINVTVPDDINGVSVNFTLLRDDPRSWSFENDNGQMENIKPMKQYLSNEEIYEQLKILDKNFPTLVQYVDGPIPCLKMSEDVASPGETKLHIALVGGLYSTEPAGRELALRLARHLYMGYKEKDSNVRTLMKEAVMHIIPVVDDIVNSKCYNTDETSNHVAQSIIDHSLVNKKASEFLEMFKDEKYDIIISVESGGLGLRHSQEHDIVRSSIYDMYGEAYKRLRPRKVGKCLETESSRVLHQKQSLLDVLHSRFNITTISAQIHCCNYIQAEAIPKLWQQYLDPLSGLLYQSMQGIKGKVVDTYGIPMRESVVSLNDSVSFTVPVTPNAAVFKFSVPPGVYEVKVQCPHHKPKVVEVTVHESSFTKLNIVVEPISFTLLPIAAVPQRSGVAGYVIDSNSHPVKNALIIVEGTNSSTYSKGNGTFWIPLPKGEHTLVATADGYSTSTKLLQVNHNKPELLIFNITHFETVMGLPRFVFIVLSVLITILVCGVGLFCYTLFRSDKFSYSGFSPIPQKTFEDDLFKTPIRGNEFLGTIPYYDESDVAEDSQSDEDIVDVLEIQQNIRRQQYSS